MFTGIITEIGTVKEIQPLGGGIRLCIDAAQSSSDLHIHDSVSVNGVCLTVTSTDGSTFNVEAVEETLKKTTLASLHAGDCVNLELPVKLNGRLGGHVVLGHVDGVGTITHIQVNENSWMFSIRIPLVFMKYVVDTGSIAIDGVSLTVAERSEEEIRISIIPHTWLNTVFQYRKVGDVVNLEFDVIGKYLERFLEREESLNEEKTFLAGRHLWELGF